MFEQSEILKLETVKERILQLTNILANSLSKHHKEVVDARTEMWREARIVIRDFDDVADLSIFAEEVARHERQYEESSRQLNKLKKMLSEPYFARIDFTEDGYDDTEKIYIGRHSLLDEKLQMFHVYDWRAPISSLYYDYGIGNASFSVPGTGGTIMGEVSLKRQYQIVKGELQYLFDNDIAIDDELLRLELSKATDANIKVIVNTIQAEQNKAIRAQAASVLVHGPAGSGKTSVGLHRLAYLLYRDRATLSSAKVRIFSPSPVFASYISGIIPELGEDDVLNIDFPTLIREKGKNMRPFNGFYQQIDHVVNHKAGDLRMLWLSHKYSATLLDELEQFVTSYTPSFEDACFNRDVVCSAQRIRELYQTRTSSSTLKSKTDRVIAFVDQAYTEYFTHKRRAITELFNDIHDDNFTDHEIKLKFDEEKSIVLRDLRSRLRPQAAKVVAKFIKKYAAKNKLPHNWQMCESETLCYEDALLFLYADILTGHVQQDKVVKHILLDEAQDLSLLHHRILQKLYPASNFTVLADVNQALYPHVSLTDLSTLRSIYATALEIPLTKSYRSTYEINNFAAHFLQEKNPNASYMRHGEEPKIIKTNDCIASTLDIISRLPNEYNTIGILLPTNASASEFFAQLDKVYPRGTERTRPIQLINTEDNCFAPGVMVTTVPFAKGLEFDAVICPNFGSKVYEGELGKRLMYLICTRALHKLYLLEEAT